MENIFVLISPNTDRDLIQKFLEEKELGELEIWSEANIPPFINPLESIVILLLSGGTELMVKQIVQKAFSSVFINCVPINGSISAAAELKGYYRGNHEIKVSSFSEDTFNLLFNIEKIKTDINRSKLLLLGKPHEWILTSENISPPSPFSSRIFPAQVRELKATMAKIKQEKAVEAAEYWDDVEDLGKVPQEEFFTAGLIYISLKSILEKYEANMLGIRCGELQEYGSAGCMAIDRLTNEGIISSCEGDIEAAFSMKIINLLTHKKGWITNISHIDFVENKLFLTHCTMPVDMYSVNNGLKGSVEGDFDFYEEFLSNRQKLPVTIFRIGKDSRWSVLEGTTQYEFLGKQCQCRSTMEVQTEESLLEWFENICGNHQVIVYGKYADQLKYFFEIL